MKLEVSDYQKIGTNFLLGSSGAALFAKPGLGKTIMTLLALNALKLARGKIRVLISAPLRVIYNVWPEEIDKWDRFNFSYSILHGPKKSEALLKDVEIYLVNPEGIKWLYSQKKNFPKWDVLVVDESSQYRNPGGVRFKTLRKMLSLFRTRYILTGTPTPRSLLGLWSQVKIIDDTDRLGPKITHYRNAYFHPVNRGSYFDWFLIDGMDPIIHERVSPLAIYMDDEEYLDLPDLVYNDLVVRLPAPVKKMYQTMSKQMSMDLGGREILAFSETEKYRLCRDIAGGAFYTERPKFEILHTEKIDAVRELVGELQGAPIIIAYHRWHEYTRLLKTFPGAPAMNGRTKGPEGRDILQRWNRGEIPILLVQPQSMSHGLNLQRGGHDLAWFSIPDDYELYEQLNRRLYRRGVEKRVRIHHIIAEGTLDRVLMSRLREKGSNQQNLFDAIHEYHSQQIG